MNILLAGLSVLMACSGTQTNDPWGQIDREEASKQSKVESSSLWSTHMRRQMTYTVWLPREYDGSKTYPFLYLLHGYEFSGNTDNLDLGWINSGNAAKVADEYQKNGGVPMVIVMPNGLNSFYQGDYETYFHEELMPLVEEKYHHNGKRAIAGLSMGGYGTLYHALKYPAKFMYAYAMSPAVQDVHTILLNAVSDVSVLPGFTIEVGTEDRVVDNAQAKSLYRKLEQKGADCEWIERTGTHDWVFWKECLPKTLQKAGQSFGK